jgi:hypothetical protein
MCCSLLSALVFYKYNDRFMKLFFSFLLIFAVSIGYFAFTSNSISQTNTVHYYVSPNGSDNAKGTRSSPWRSIQYALEQAMPGETIKLMPGEYRQDVRSVRSGAKDRLIRIVGTEDAVIYGGGEGRVMEIHHDYITLEGFTLNGKHAESEEKESYRDKLLYVLGKQPRDGVEGMRILNMHFKNGGGECLRMRYFAQNNEVAHSTFHRCGVHDYEFDAGGKNGEAIYIGTAPEQRGDGKNPTEDVDQSNNNWIHHNTFDTQGNECVDIKEGASGNIVEHNDCTGQLDPESGGFDSRGNGNIFRFNKAYENAGAGVRLGGDGKKDGINNDVYENILMENGNGAVKLMRWPQGKICGNVAKDNDEGKTSGNFDDKVDPTEPCTD